MLQGTNLFLKCHGWGHLLYNCLQAFNTCGTCAGHHRMADCTQWNRLCCTPCKVDGHASWDRQCPTFIHKCEELNTRLTENNMPYFPTNELWTHVLQPPKAAYQAPPLVLMTAAKLTAAQRGNYMQ